MLIKLKIYFFNYLFYANLQSFLTNNSISIFYHYFINQIFIPFKMKDLKNF